MHGLERPFPTRLALRQRYCDAQNCCSLLVIVAFLQTRSRIGRGIVCFEQHNSSKEMLGHTRDVNTVWHMVGALADLLFSPMAFSARNHYSLSLASGLERTDRPLSLLQWRLHDVEPRAWLRQLLSEGIRGICIVSAEVYGCDFQIFSCSVAHRLEI